MKFSSLLSVAILILVLSSLQQVYGLRFVIDRQECVSHNVQYIWDRVHVSFVVIKSDSHWHSEYGVDLVVTGPKGDQIQDLRGKTCEKFEFVVYSKGPYKFCFTNKSPYYYFQTIDLDVYVGHYNHNQHAKDEHVEPLKEQIEKLGESLFNIQFEQHWLEAETKRQELVNEDMSKRAIHKAVFESLALIGGSMLQIYLLRRLFERKLKGSTV